MFTNLNENNKDNKMNLFYGFGAEMPELNKRNTVELLCDYLSIFFVTLIVSTQTRVQIVPICASIEVFVNNTNLTFLSFLYKIRIEVS